MLAWELTSAPCADDIARVAEGVLAHGRALALGGDPQPIACLVREDGRLIAGGAGRTEFNRLFITSLWVEAPYRGQGIGTKIIQRMESEALRAGCTSAAIETLDDRVALLYKRLGYEAVATLPQHVGPFTRHILVKRTTRG
jgi:GNAT superfamily N-acetyltransferase